MEKTRYGLNYSQDIVTLQTKYSLFKRVLNIVFKISLKDGFDKKLMTDAINKVFERNDCLRIKFVKDGKQTKQFFEDHREVGEIPCREFSTFSQMEKFMRRFCRRATNPFTGEVLEVVYCTEPSGKDFILFKICHLCADTYGIGILLGDLLSVYDALKNGTELPPMPGSFEAILQKEEEYRHGSDAREKDLEFFQDYYTKKHTQAPLYCGINGNACDSFMKQKRKGKFAIPYRPITCDTKSYGFDIPKALSDKSMEWCDKYKISPSALYMYTYSVVTSMVNGRAPYQTPLNLLNCRATLSDRKAAGTKVQSISVYTTVDYEKSFLDNINAMLEEQNELYRHTKLSYLEVEALQHKQWGHSMLSQTTNFCFSFIPMVMPEGTEFQMISNGKGALVCYIGFIFNPETHSMGIGYDIQTKMITPEQLIEFHNKFISVLETVMDKPDQKLSQIL
jgi:Condensation domain.